MAKKTITEIITALLILLFVYAAVSKLIDFKIFISQLGRAPWFGQFSGLLAIILPAGELVIVTLLLFPRTKITGLWASFLAMLVFTAYVALLLLSGKHLPCTCGGLIRKLSWPQHLIFNLLFSLIALIAIILNRKNRNDQYKLAKPLL